MAKTTSLWSMALMLLLCGRDLKAASITISTNQTLDRPQPGDQAVVALSISELSTTLGAFDLTLSFDDSILVPNRITFSSMLGAPDVIVWGYDASGGVFNPISTSDPTLTGALTAASTTTTPGTVQVLNVSLLDEAELAARQPLSFPLVIFVFDTLRVGRSDLGIFDITLGDGAGNRIDATVTGERTLSVHTPEPATLLLLLGSLPVAAWRARRWRGSVRNSRPATACSPGAYRSLPTGVHREP